MSCDERNPMAHLIPFDGDPLDRVANERHDEAWVAARLADPAARFLPLWRLQVPVVGGEPPHLSWAASNLLDRLNGGPPPVLLGLLGGVPHFALDVSEFEEPV